jgi:hypothetical protein
MSVLGNSELLVSAPERLEMFGRESGVSQSNADRRAHRDSNKHLSTLLGSVTWERSR